MSESYIRVPTDSFGKRVRMDESTISGEIVQTQIVKLTNDTNNLINVATEEKQNNIISNLTSNNSLTTLINNTLTSNNSLTALIKDNFISGINILNTSGIRINVATSEKQQDFITIGGVDVLPIVEPCFLVEGFESLTGFTYSTDISNVALSTEHRGIGSNSISFDKSGTTEATAVIQKTITSFDAHDICDHFYINYSIKLPSITNISSVYVALGSDSSNYIYWQKNVSDLVAGWNNLYTPLGSPTSQIGNGIDYSNITWVGILIAFNSISNTLVGIKVDNIELHSMEIVGAAATEAKQDDIISTLISGINILNTSRVRINPSTEDTLTSAISLLTNTVNRLTSGIIFGKTGDTTYQVPRLDVETHALQTIDYSHHEIHAGTSYNYIESTDVGNGANRDILIVTPDTTKWPHITIDTISEAEADAKLYEGIGLTSNGIFVNSYNRDRNSATSATTSLWHTPDGVSGGTLLFQKHWGSGRANGGMDKDTTERILKQNTKYLYRVNNATANNNYITIILNWYEHINRSA